jgi:hypothetical protein
MLFRVYSRYVPNLTRNDGSAMDRLLTHTFVGTGDKAPAVNPLQAMVIRDSQLSASHQTPSQPLAQAPPDNG